MKLEKKKKCMVSQLTDKGLGQHCQELIKFETEDRIVTFTFGTMEITDNVKQSTPDELIGMEATVKLEEENASSNFRHMLRGFTKKVTKGLGQ